MSEEEARQHAAAHTIQALFRGRRVRRGTRLAELRDLHRRNEEKKRLEILKKHESIASKAQQQMQDVMHHIESDAAVKIQSVFRGIKARRIYAANRASHPSNSLSKTPEESLWEQSMSSEAGVRVFPTLSDDVSPRSCHLLSQEVDVAASPLSVEIHPPTGQRRSPTLTRALTAGVGGSEVRSNGAAESPVGSPQLGGRRVVTVSLSPLSGSMQPRRLCTSATASDLGRAPSPPLHHLTKNASRAGQYQRRLGPHPVGAVDPAVLRAVVKVQDAARRFLARRRYERVSEQVRLVTRGRGGASRGHNSTRVKGSNVDLEAMFNVPTPPRRQTVSARGRGGFLHNNKGSKSALPEFVL